MSKLFTRFHAALVLPLALTLATGLACDPEATTEERAAEMQGHPHPHDGDQGHHGAKGDHGKKGHHGKKGSVDPETHAKKLQEKLGLSDDQAAKAAAIFAEYQPKMDALRDQMKGAHEDAVAQRTGEATEAGDRDARKEEWKGIKEQRRALHEQQSAKIKALLTPEQVAQFDEMMSGHGDKRGHDCAGDCGGECPYKGKKGEKGDCAGECPHKGEGECSGHPHKGEGDADAKATEQHAAR